MDIVIEHVDDIPSAATTFLDAIGHRKVIAFDAPMGTGKTTFITGVLQAMGIESPEGSPTYSLVNVYDSRMFGKVYHFDLYRINDEAEALDMGVEEMIYSNSYCLIEWPDVISGLLPEDTLHVSIRQNEDGVRVMSFELN